jgi:F-type H+-transporting ATPase subunit b
MQSMSEQQIIFWQLIAEAAAPPLQVKLDTMIFSLIIFGILLAVLAKYAWKPILEGLDNREKSIAKNIDDARTSSEKAQALLAQYEQKLRAASDEATKMVAEARADAEKARERIVTEAKEEAQRQRDRAIAEINAARDAAVRELAERSVDSAVMLASRIVGKSLKPDDHARLIEQSLERFSRN